EDRTGHPHVLNMTHEEVVVDAVGASVESYRQLPLMVYQIQTKFRDEPRSRGGLVRVREFTMKDAYSFHRTDEDLERYYQEVHGAYVRIFERVGLKAVDIESDVGMMGGQMAHEFMALSPHGEDTLLLCDSCDYRANREVATTTRSSPAEEEMAPLEKVSTPGTKTIEAVSTLLKTTADRTAKAVLFMGHGEVEDPKGKKKVVERPIVAFVRGDLEVNQAKLRNAARALDLRPMQVEETEQIGTVAGFVGPIGLAHEHLIVLVDETVAQTPNLVVGANEADAHLTGFNLSRDCPDATVADLAEVKEGDACPSCGAPLRMARGIEVGNIFQLGLKYTKSMGFEYLEENGKSQHPTMGCYGIGVGRTLACIIEAHHDEHGPLWPMAVAPYEAEVCCIQAKKPGVLDAGEGIYKQLCDGGVEALIDDRKVGAGFMFADADLISAPVRIIVSPRNLKEGKVEMKYRLPEGTAERKELDGLLPAEASLEEAPEIAQRAVEALRRG
ncbi:MAG: proline--tRNA ligase, partial [Myxococcota bacterium]